jgi:hypothetical protein
MDEISILYLFVKTINSSFIGTERVVHCLDKYPTSKITLISLLGG